MRIDVARVVPVVASDAELVPTPIVVLGDAHPSSEVELGEDDLDHEAEATEPRRAHVGKQVVELYGRVLAAGDIIDGDFTITAARGSCEPLTGDRLRRGLVVMTTLPNIHKHACAAQIVQTELLARSLLPRADVMHVASDAPAYWQEVDHFHGDVQADGYSLALSADADAFRAMFGVGVRGSHRIARGLFSIWHGTVLAADVPEDQGRSPNVRRFIERTRSLLAIAPRSEVR